MISKSASLDVQAYTAPTHVPRLKDRIHAQPDVHESDVLPSDQATLNCTHALRLLFSSHQGTPRPWRTSPAA